MSESKRFTPDRVAQFFEVLHQTAARAGDVDAVLISAEPFYRGLAGEEGPYWARRERYVGEVRSVIPFDDAQVTVVLRRQDDYLESLYNEHVKVTRYPKDCGRGTSRQPRSPRSRTSWPRRTSRGASWRWRWVAGTWRSGRSHESRNPSLPADLVEFKRLLNATPLSRSELAAVVRSLLSAARARGEAPGRQRWLSEADCASVLAEFADDNGWINERYFSARPEGLFPPEVRPRRTVEPLDARACARITAEVLRSWRPPPRQAQEVVTGG